MKCTARILIAALATGCVPTSATTRRPLSECAKHLVESGYLAEHDTGRADTYCRTRSPAEIATARSATDAGRFPTFDAAIAANHAEAEGPRTQPKPETAVQPEPVSATALAPAAVVETPSPVADPEASVARLDVLAIAENDPDLSTFVALLRESGMADAVRDAKVVTLLAPTNAAFEKFPRLAANKNRLREVLSMHVLWSELSCVDAPVTPAQPKRLTTMSGKPLPMRAKGKVVSIGRAKVLRADLVASNGILEIIDAVLLP